MARPTVKQFGFATGAGALANIVDGSKITFWQPLATTFDFYTAQFFTPDGTALNYGGSFPAIEWDFGSPTRALTILLETATILTLGPGVLIGSSNPATSVTDTLQSGDTFLAQFSAGQITSNMVLQIPATSAADLRFRYYRLLQRTSASAFAPLGPTNSRTLDSGAGSFAVVDYTDKFIIEIWGAGASGGISGNAQDGGNSTCATYALTAEGGKKATTTGPNSGTGAGLGGAASGGNTANITGEGGSPPAPATSDYGISGKGGDAPFGSVGGAGISNWSSGFPGSALAFAILYGTKAGQLTYGFGLEAETGPGGGGSGRNIWQFLIGASKYPGGGAGGYVKHVLTKGIDGPITGNLIAYAVGAGGISTQPDGGGARGRVRFSWT